MKQCPRCHLTYPSESAFCFLDGESLVTPTDPRIGETLSGRYVIQKPLGEGGMAVVYQARHKLVDKPCAIKILRHQSGADPVLRERFLREARLAQRLTHTNIIEIFDQGETPDGMPFLVMELLEGQSLACVVEQGRMPLARVLPIAIEITRALAHAHDFEVVHRDLKPENVFLLPIDRVKLLDFGIARFAQDARLTTMGEIFGTPQYMAPERGSSMDAGPPADLYALGILLFEMLTQNLPFHATDPATWLQRHRREPAPRLRSVLPTAPEALDQLIFDLMAKDPAHRPIDAHRVLASLVAIAQAANVPCASDAGGAAGATVAEIRPTRDPWERRLEIFGQMVARAFPGGAPADVTRPLDVMRSHLREIGELTANALDEQQKLDGIETGGREGRARLAKAMVVLTSDVFKTREEARALRAGAAPLGAAAREFPQQMLGAHRDVVQWEGRSGFAEPYRELAAGYRRLAELVDAWYIARQRELEVEGEAVKRERVIADVDLQIRGLRESLSNLDRGLVEQRFACQKKLAEMGKRSELLEGEVLHLATRFCGPLRSRPELGQLFNDLERSGLERA